ncbi:hypothetical protein [Mesorhizobium sp. B1-1-5]|nr:hypothetical protein [Mesorhizobium sp. B1-1-5]
MKRQNEKDAENASFLPISEASALREIADRAAPSGDASELPARV